MGHEMHRRSTRTAPRFVSLYTPFLPGHTRYEIVQVLERPDRGLSERCSGRDAQEDRILTAVLTAETMHFVTHRYTRMDKNGPTHALVTPEKPRLLMSSDFVRLSVQ